MANIYISNTTAGIDRSTSINLTNTDVAIIARDAEVYTGNTAVSTSGLTGAGERVFVTNHGSIMGAIDLRSNSTGRADAYVDNSQTGIVDGLDYLGVYTQGNLFLSMQNDGVIQNSSTGYTAIDIRGLGAKIINNGDISGSRGGIHISTVSGQNSEIINSGAISSVGSGSSEGIVAFGTGSLSVLNSGTIIGRVSFTSGTDLYDGAGGSVLGQISGGLGNDTLRGGAMNDDLNGGDDNDLLAGRGGVDRLNGGNGSDTLYFDSDDLRFGSVLGGTGYDTGYNTDETTPLAINLQVQQLEAYFGSAADEMVIAGDLGGFGLFAITGAGDDLIEGTSVGDNVNGGMGVDVLYGRGGADDLAGGIGGDWVQGGSGADTFRYNSLLDSTVNGQDFIADFSTAESDKINLTNALAGLPAATFNTGYGTGTSVYVFAGGGGTSLVQVYTASTLQMQIVVSQASLAASDFVL